MLYIVPESPYFLFQCGKEEETKHVLIWLYGNDNSLIVDEAFTDIKMYFQHEDNNCDGNAKEQLGIKHSEITRVDNCPEEGVVLVAKHLPIEELENTQEQGEIKPSQSKLINDKTAPVIEAKRDINWALVKISTIVGGIFLFSRFCGMFIG